MIMYTITRGPSKLVTQRRTGPGAQQIETKSNEFRNRQSPWTAASSQAPKLVFNRLNGKRYHGAPSQGVDSQPEGFTEAHEENVRFVYEAWQQVEQRLGNCSQLEGGQGPVQYSEKTPNPDMKNFVPIDLDEWWAQRFLANIANLS
ncbi:MAPK regulated corepressor interacting protein 2-like isoform X1 [Scleropages formosus]|uniref:MAPK regulated corepressor interacting protein 2-like isoform X1 n=1 Tax=Scleropages formosus TaxID=113540 RepID=UPI00087839F2|nr:MAPK regulated corepressor interacting protein 2-like isoform X1 [Scleropages formosus]